MKTPKEKAEDLFQLYLPFVESGHIEEIKYRCKQCVLIAVDEMIAFAKHAFSHINIELATPSIVYLEEVKQEIEKL
jgi:hypothetical protein